MKKLMILILICYAWNTHAQQILNGSFEDNDLIECNYGLSNNGYNLMVANSTAFSTWVVAMFDVNCPWDGGVQDGSWMVGLGGQDTLGNGPERTAISLELSDTLWEGEWYKLSFYLKKPLPSPNGLNVFNNQVEIGLSEVPDEFGAHIFTSEFPDSIWTLQEVVFQAPPNIKHITCRALIMKGGEKDVFADHFVLSTDTTTVSIVEPLKQAKKLLRIIDILGRESKPQPNIPLFYLYDDGTVEKKVLLE